MMFALNQIIEPCGHVVTQIVETEFVVRTESDITFISTPSGIAVRLMLVDTVYRQSMEHVKRSHPL